MSLCSPMAPAPSKERIVDSRNIYRTLIIAVLILARRRRRWRRRREGGGGCYHRIMVTEDPPRRAGSHLLGYRKGISVLVSSTSPAPSRERILSRGPADRSTAGWGHVVLW
ncbi:hypothetical protein OH76DRAFT_842492 [Lentinus brumalis]|uniref:Uncharacterized protein n=1 Tax=Lentinus brumalis TaxID=2498619 RepID=A0A371D1R7_9APHY|nr:hypothetical protein OH76DRAFT_842492 [Polyporus brumalis]